MRNPIHETTDELPPPEVEDDPIVEPIVEPEPVMDPEVVETPLVNPDTQVDLVENGDPNENADSPFDNLFTNNDLALEGLLVAMAAAQAGMEMVAAVHHQRPRSKPAWNGCATTKTVRGLGMRTTSCWKTFTPLPLQAPGLETL